jgi:hypothetical protein
MDWNQMSYGVPDLGKPCLIRSIKGNYYVATFELFGRIGRWVTTSNGIYDMDRITHWSYITPPNE